MAKTTREEELEAQLLALQRQLAELQQQLAHQADVTQGTALQQAVSGGIAVGEGAKASGAYSVVANLIHGNVYVGKPLQNEQEALNLYRRVYIATCRKLPLRGIDVGTSDAAGDQQRLDLDQVYIALDTTTRVEREEKRGEDKRTQQRLLRDQTKEAMLSLLDAAIQMRRLVILGGPGSGKSTFLNYLGLCLALQGSEPEGSWIQRLPKWPQSEATLLPIAVTLRDFAQTMAATTQPATPYLLWQFIVSHLQAQNLDLVANWLHEALEAGTAIVLLDGLDEIPTQRQRSFVRDCVAVFASRYPRAWLLVTCRTLSYQDPAWQLTELPSVEIAPFDDEKIRDFIAAWYDTLAHLNMVTQEEANHLAQRLQDAVERPELHELADNPLLLTVMALVHTHRGQLPDARALLYEETVDILLWRWEEVKVTTRTKTTTLRRLLHEADRSDVDLKRVLWQLAYEAHSQAAHQGNDDAPACIDELSLVKALTALHPNKDRNWADQIIQAMNLHDGLLVKRAPEVYTFFQHIFQEYLAGSRLASTANFVQTAAKLAQYDFYWWQVILLAVGRLVYLAGNVDKPLSLVDELSPQRRPQSKQDWYQVWLAGEILNEIGLHRVNNSALGQELHARIRQWLAELLRSTILTSVERVAVIRVLTHLDDSGRDELVSLADTYLAQGQVHEAIFYYDQALQIAHELGDQSRIIANFLNLATAYQTIGQTEQALGYYEQRVAALLQQTDHLQAAEALLTMSKFALEKGLIDQARQYLTTSRAIYAEHKLPYDPSIDTLFAELSALQHHWSLAEASFIYFEKAGFIVERREEPGLFIAQPDHIQWVNSVKTAVIVKIIPSTVLERQAVLDLVAEAHVLLNDKPHCIFVICEHKPATTAWLQIATLRAEGIRIMPILTSVLITGEQTNRHRAELLDYLESRFLSPQLDLYDTSTPVSDQLNFFGREKLAAQLLNDLERGTHLALFGLRKMGKSSLIRYLRDELPYPVALVDLQSGVEPVGVYQRILNDWVRTLQVKFPTTMWMSPTLTNTKRSSEIFTKAANQLLDELDKHHSIGRLAIFVDEIELIWPMEQSDLKRYLAFARTLRGLAQERLGQVALIIAGVDPKIVRKNRLYGQQNPFYNFFRVQYLPPLSSEDCQQMISNIGAQMDIQFENTALDFVVQVSGGHPYWARKLCSLAFQNWKGNGPITYKHLETMAKLFVQDPDTATLLDKDGLWGEVTDSYVWTADEINANESILMNLAMTEPRTRCDLVSKAVGRNSYNTSLYELHQRSILVQPNQDAYWIQLRLFRNWIRSAKLGEE